MNKALPLDLGAQLSHKVAAGRKLVVPYLTCGLPTPGDFIDLYVKLGGFADAIEVGIPFSDPVMDGPVIQQASARALQAGITVDGCLGLIAEARARVDAPAVVMTYFNPVHSAGLESFAGKAAAAGICGLIVPDLPYEESLVLRSVLEKRGISLVQLVSPTTPDARVATLAAASRGWVYAISRMGVTGEQDALAAVASQVVGRIRSHTRLPVLVGVGISSPELAAEACRVADGVIVGSAVVKRVLADDLTGAVDLIRAIRQAVGE